jgi:GINS complex subunit 1
MSAASRQLTDPATELLKEVKALNASGGVMTPVDGINVRSLASSVVDTFQNIEAMSINPFVNAADPYYASSLQYYRAKCLREKRCLVAYLKWRMDRATASWWETQDNLIMPQLTPAEQKYLKDYNDIMVEYMSSFAVPLDLRAFRWRPPTSQNITVRGLKASSFVGSTGTTYHIEKGETHSMPCEEAERLIQQGIVAPLSE